MAQPKWITPAGSLGVIPEGVFYSVPVRAVADDQDVFFQLIAGELPDGVQVTSNGFIEGTPRNTIKVQGVPQEVSEDVTSKFAIRAYTVKVINSNIVIDRLADRTFTLTISGQDIPEFTTPPGRIGTFYDGTEARVKVDFTDTDPDETLTVKLVAGEFPPGMRLNSRTGEISGVIIPSTGVIGAPAGYDATEYDQYPWDFATRSNNRNYQFTLEVTDGKDSDVRTFEIFVYAKNTMVADTTDNTADDTFITADVTPDRPPVLLTPEGDLGVVRADNWYAFKFDAIDFDGEPIEYLIDIGAGIGYDDAPYDAEGFDRGAFSLPPGLEIDPFTGWFYGYIPDQGVTEQTYKFAVRVRNRVEPAEPWNPALQYSQGSIVSLGDSNYTARQNVPAGIVPTNTLYWEREIIPISRYYYFTITITGQVETEIQWLTPKNLGEILNGSASTFSIQAVNAGGRSLQYRLAPGTASRLPQGLKLLPSGNIVGRVSFNTFAMDSGITTFDRDIRTRTITRETTFDMQFDFTVNAFSSEAQQIGYRVGSIRVVDGGSGYDANNPPTVVISPPPETIDSIPATAGVVSVNQAGEIVAIEVGNPGRGYLSAPTITILGSGGTGAQASANIIEARISNAVSVFRDFRITVVRRFNEPYQKIYVKCMPPQQDRELILQLIQNQDTIPNDLVYRADDPNFGVAKNVVYDHAYGLNSAPFAEYVESLNINHYWKNVTLGRIRTAQALDSRGRVLYEVVYSEIVDDLVNNLGESVSKEIRWPRTIRADDQVINTVYPNSLINMRDQVIDSIGEIPPPLTPALPIWMTSKQKNGRVLGFTPAWIIAYVKPGKSQQVLYNIQQQFGDRLNLVDFKIDRYELDRSQTYNWDPDDQQWIPTPPAETTFDTFTDAPAILPWINIAGNEVIWSNQESEIVFWQTPPSGIPLEGTIFDGRTTRFISPADRWTGTDDFDKYLLFPKTNILG